MTNRSTSIITRISANGTGEGDSRDGTLFTSADALLLDTQITRARGLWKTLHWTTVLVPARSKRPEVTGWNKVTYERAEDVNEEFQRQVEEYERRGIHNGAHFNLCLLTGAASNDVFVADLDHPLVARLAPRFLPETDAVAGREGKPSSKWLYRVPGFDLGKMQFWLSGEKRGQDAGDLALEILGNGFGAVIPPGVHNSGEAVRWEPGRSGTPATVPGEELIAACGKLAATVLMVELWIPARRHSIAYPLGGWLAKQGWSLEEAENWVSLIAVTAGDEEVPARLRDVRGSYALLQREGSRKVTGASGLVEVIGKEKFDLLAQYLLADEESRLLGRPLRGQIRELMAKGKKSEGDYGKVVRLVISDLDARGVRYRHAEMEGIGFYFDRTQNKFTQVDWNAKPQAFAVTDFGLDLYRQYGITQNHTSIVNRLRSAFLIDAREVEPQSFTYATPDALYLQQATSDVLKVTREGAEIVPNGTDDVLFLPIRMETAAIDLAAVLQPPRRILRELINQLSLDEHQVFTDEELRALLEVYFHLAPHLWKWRELQLPFIVAQGEAGSGKSDLWHLMQGIALGAKHAHLRRTPNNMKDFDVYAYNARGFFVLDNFKNGTVKPYLADFESALSTAITLGYSERRLFHTQREEQYQMRALPGLSTTEQVLFSDDVITRLLVVPFKKLVFDEKPGVEEEEESIGLWAKEALTRRPGRDALYTDQIAALRRFLELAAEQPARHRRRTDRLAGFGSALLRMGEALGGEEMLEVMNRVLDKLPEATAVTQTSADKALLILREFAVHRLGRVESQQSSPSFRLGEVITFTDLFHRNGAKPIYPFADATQLANYIRGKKALVYQQTGIRDTGKRPRNTALYEIDLELVRSGWKDEDSEETSNGGEGGKWGDSFLNFEL